jgi:DNA polymerase V
LGVRLGPLLNKQQVQYDCFSAQDNQKSAMLMTTLDQINQRHGKDSLFYASQGVERVWKMKRQFCSPCYTTRWDELLKVN